MINQNNSIINQNNSVIKNNNTVLKLNKDYAISSDDLNLTLHKCMVVTKEDSKKYGEEYFPVVGYYSSVEGLLKGLVQKQINIEVEQQETLEKVNESVEKYISLLHDDVREVVKHLKGGKG